MGEGHPDCRGTHRHARRHNKISELTVESERGHSTARKKGSSTPCSRMLGLVDTSQARVLDRTHEGNTNPLFADTRSRGQQPELHQVERGGEQHKNRRPSLLTARSLQARRTKGIPVVTVTYPGHGGQRKGSFPRRYRCN